MNRLEIAKQKEQEAFLEIFRTVCAKYNEKKDIRSISHAMKFLRESIRKGISPMNKELSRVVFIGTKLLPLLEQAVAFLPRPEKTADLFGKTRVEAVRFGATDTSRSLFYTIRHPREVWSALTSMKFGHALFGKFFPFDPKGFAKNISGLLFEEKIGESSSIYWTMGPTPTVGQSIAPEMECMIEALEKNEKWVYVNLQSLGSKDERPRSLALLEASKKHPGRFCAASVSVDSPLYQGREGEDIHEQKKLLLMQLSRAVFLNETEWYFFSLRPEEKEAWWSIVEEVIERAFLLSRQESSVFHELVILGLIRAWQAFHMEKEMRLIATIACKECIDRGGSVNAAFMWALLEDEISEKDRAFQVMAVLWGRPLLARKRLIDKSRTKGFSSLVKNLSPNAVRTYLSGIWSLHHLMPVSNCVNS